MTPTQQKRDRLGGTAVVLGGLAVLLTLATAFAGRSLTVRIIEDSIRTHYADKAAMLVQVLRSNADRSDEEALQIVHAAWQATENRPGDEYLCLVDRNADLLLHTAHPETVGDYAGANPVMPNSSSRRCTLAELAQQMRAESGGYISSAGQEQVVAFAPIPERGWMLGVHRSEAQVVADISAQLRYITISFFLICGVMLPLSLFLLHRTYRMAIKRREQTDRALRDMQQRYRDLYMHLGNGVAIYEAVEDGADFLIRDINPAGVEISKLSEEQVEGRRITEMFPEISSNGLLEVLRQVWSDGCPRRQPVIRHRNDQLELWVENYVCRLSSGEIVTTFEDITERKRMEAALHEREERYRCVSEQYQALFERMLDGFALHEIVLDSGGNPVDYRFLEVNPAFESITGLSAAEVVGRSVLEVLPDTERYWIETFGRVAVDGAPVRFEQYTAPLDRWFSVLAYRPAEGQFACIFQDITEAHRAGEARDRLFSHSMDMLCVAGLDGTLREMNPAWSRVLGWSEEELKADSWLGLVHPDDRPATETMLNSLRRGQRAEGFENRCRTKDGDYRWLSWNASPLPEESLLFGVARDVTEAKREAERSRVLEEQLAHSQKMEAVGTLAGGIAHDFNNILSAIIGFTELALAGVPAQSEEEDCLREVLAAAGRARSLVKQILAFGRKETLERKPVDSYEVVREALRLLQASLPSTITIREQLDPAAGLLLADATQVHQVVMNLVANAYHALRDTGGLLEVELESVLLPTERFAASGLAAGRYVKLTVRDSGPGIEEAILAHIFEPYFTTKPRGEGTGMGLAAVHGIVTGYGGMVEVSSQPGKGACFEVLLPAWDGSLTGVEREREEGESVVTGKDEHVLFVDDEPGLVRLWERGLRHLGYTVTGETSAVDALERFRADPLGFDALVTDQTMPGMTGDRLAQAVLALRPNLPVVICTGHSETLDERRAREIGVRALLLKPLERAELGRELRRILDAEGEA